MLQHVGYIASSNLLHFINREFMITFVMMIKSLLEPQSADQETGEKGNTASIVTL